MQAIISQVKETIQLKKKQMAEHQSEVNEAIYRANNKVKALYELKNDIDRLENEIYLFENGPKSNIDSANLQVGCDFAKPNVGSKLI